MKTKVSIETNRLHIDRVEVYLHFADDDRSYKVYASNSSAQEPLTILGNVVRSYSVAGFKNNPHWLLHYHSAKCDAWQEDHDDSAFGKYIWNNYIKKKMLGSIDIYASPLHCAGTSNAPAYVEPAIPEIGPDEIEQWLGDNKASFKSHVNNNKAECQIRTGAVIREEAITQKKCGKKPECPLVVPTDLDTWGSKLVNEKVNDLGQSNNKLKFSNEGLITDIDDETGSSCFYKKPLKAGIKVKITGQMLVNVGGKLMTRRKADKCILTDTGLDANVIDDNRVYINLGLNAQSYPIITDNSGDERDGRFDTSESGLIRDTYTQNFAMRDIRFLHLEKTANEKFFTHEEIDKTIHDKFWGRYDPTVGHVSVAVEQGIVAISSIELNFNDNVIYSLGSPPESREEDEGTEIDCSKEDSDVLKDVLFVLTNSSNVWVDYNVHGNNAWADYRDKKDHNCVEEE